MSDQPRDGLGPMMRRMRTRKFLAGQRVARIAGLDPSYISRIESGQRAPTRAVLLRICAALDCNDDERDQLIQAAMYLPVGQLRPLCLAALAELDAVYAAGSEDQRESIRRIVDVTIRAFRKDDRWLSIPASDQ